MKSILSLTLTILVLFASSILALSSSGTRVLVLLDDLLDQPSYSRFWKSLEGNVGNDGVLVKHLTDTHFSLI